MPQTKLATLQERDGPQYQAEDLCMECESPLVWSESIVPLTRVSEPGAYPRYVCGNCCRARANFKPMEAQLKEREAALQPRETVTRLKRCPGCGDKFYGPLFCDPWCVACREEKERVRTMVGSPRVEQQVTFIEQKSAFTDRYQAAREMIDFLIEIDDEPFKGDRDYLARMLLERGQVWCKPEFFAKVCLSSRAIRECCIPGSAFQIRPWNKGAVSDCNWWVMA